MQDPQTQSSRLKDGKQESTFTFSFIASTCKGIQKVQLRKIKFHIQHIRGRNKSVREEIIKVQESKNKDTPEVSALERQLCSLLGCTALISLATLQLYPNPSANPDIFISKNPTPGLLVPGEAQYQLGTSGMSDEQCYCLDSSPPPTKFSI